MKKITLTWLDTPITYSTRTNALFFFSRLYGFGIQTVQKMFFKLGLDCNLCLGDLTSAQLDLLRHLVHWEGKKKLEFLGDNRMQIVLQKELKIYKGMRKDLGLPSNGQRTRCNARTTRYLFGGGEKRQEQLSAWKTRRDKRSSRKKK